MPVYHKNHKLFLVTIDSLGDVINRSEKLLPLPIQAKTVNVFKWNAETLDTDFTHVTRGIPASTNSILLELPGFSDPNSWHRVRDKQVFAALEQTFNTWRRNGASK